MCMNVTPTEVAVDIAADCEYIYVVAVTGVADCEYNYVSTDGTTLYASCHCADRSCCIITERTL